MIGLVQRTTSSTAESIRRGLRTSLRISFGCSMNASIPPVVPLRVVSLPAITMIRQKVRTSISGMRSPSTSRWAKSEIRSSLGLRRFSSTSFAK